MMPLQDLNPTRRLPITTWILIAINVIVFFWEMSLSEQALNRAFLEISVVPANLTANLFSIESILDIVRSMFLHGGYDHILGNMLYLYLFGDNIEDRFGFVLFLVLYFVSGVVAVFAQVTIDPTSRIPLIGASGAIAGVLGAYLVLFPNVKVRGIVGLGRIGTMQEWPAFIVLGMWFVLQLVSGVGSLGADYGGGGVAFFAHIGGFVAGAVMALIFMVLVPQAPANERNQMLYQRSDKYRF